MPGSRAHLPALYWVHFCLQLTCSQALLGLIFFFPGFSAHHSSFPTCFEVILTLAFHRAHEVEAAVPVQAFSLSMWWLEEARPGGASPGVCISMSGFWTQEMHLQWNTSRHSGPSN